MTRKRLFVIAGILASVACIVLATLVMLPPRPGVTKANFDRIEEGMTLSDVEAIFAEPARGKGLTSHTDKKVLRTIAWFGADDSHALIMFEGDIVYATVWTASDETGFDKFCRWVHWPWW